MPQLYYQLRYRNTYITAYIQVVVSNWNFDFQILQAYDGDVQFEEVQVLKFR